MKFLIALSEAFTFLSTIHLVLSSPSFSPSAYHDLSARSTSGSKNVIIQMFEWNWDSVAAECTDFIGSAGYGFVQVSPPQEHITGDQWWTDYQPVSYTLTSKRGNRTQFQNMISACHTAGVKVIADTIFNHMTALNGSVGVAGSSFSQYVYPGIYDAQDFHYCGLEPNNDIVDYDNRLEVQTCQLDGLADLGTDTEPVRATLAAYANDLLSLGVDGLRLDAAKNIAATDINNITSRLSSKPYITQEVIFGAGQPILPSEYVGNGDVLEFRYATALQNAFSGASGGISSLQNLDNLGWVPGTQANVFVADHDTERSGASLNITSPSNTYITASIFSLAHPYGTPTVLSSYSFSTYDQGAPNNGTGNCTETGGAIGWICQHRYVAISGMVGFRNAVGSTPLTDWVSPNPQQIAFGRGSIGFVAINNVDQNWNTTFSTSLPDGKYCDVISGTKTSSGLCTGISVTVSNGSFTASVYSRSAIAIHTLASGSQSSAAVNFKQTTSTRYVGIIVLLTISLQFLMTSLVC
jgi:hypothetical protein